MRREGEVTDSDTRTLVVSKQEKIYADAGINPETVLERIEQIKKMSKESEVKGFRGFTEVNQDYAIYVNPSDSIELLEHTRNLEGGKVLTVAGSGEFSQAFIDLGAKEVDIVDLSWSGCFYTELKLAAIRQLSYEDYLKLFRTLNEENAIKVKPYKDADYKIKTWKLFDPVMYPKVREDLSIQARTFFDTITQPGNQELFTFKESSWNGPVRYRRPDSDDRGPYRFSNTIPQLQHRELFEHLKQRLAETEVTIKVGNILEQGDYSNYDYVYLSNVTYNQQALMAGKLLSKGAKRVGFTLNDYDLGLAQFNSRSSNPKQYRFSRYNQDDSKSPEIEIINQELDVYGYSKPSDTNPKESISMKGKLIGIDRRSGYGALMEVTQVIK
jgi:hypothetical protein